MVSAGPPEGVDSAALWDRLAKKDRPRLRDIPFPRLDETGKPEFMLSMVVLHHGEIMSAIAASEKYARVMLPDAKARLEGSLGYEGLFREGQAIELLLRACKRNEADNMHVPVFMDAAQMRRDLTDDEIAVLLRTYTDWQAESGPILGTMTEGEKDAWLAKLKEGGSRLPLASLSLEARTDLLMHSVALLRSSSTGSGSAGSPPSASLDGSGSPPDATPDP